MVDASAAIGERSPITGFGCVTMRIVTLAVSIAFAGLLLSGADLRAQTAPEGIRLAQASPAVTDVSAQRRRPRGRLRIYPREQWQPDVYPRYNPGPNAVRDCTATYAPEYRPSGTVITPRVSCYWRRG